MLALGRLLYHQGALTVGALVAYLSYVAMVQSPIQAFTRLPNQLQQSLVSYGADSINPARKTTSVKRC